MSYQVLARKWRPQRFSEVVGQQHVLSALENGLREGRLHHAYLFSGTRGVGKTSIARLFAKGLNCETGITATPCGECANCKAIEEGRFIDLIEIDAASRTKVEDTRELLDNVQYKPTVGRFKVYLIDEVHMLSRHSFNALLKTLEEPPEYVKFLLATTDPQKLPITILSRCMQFHLRALDQAQIANHLEFILQQENISYESAAIEKLAKAAQGSIRDSLSLTDQAIAVSNANISLPIVQQMLGLIDDHQPIELVTALAQADGEKAMSVIQSVAEKGVDWSQLLSDIAQTLHQIAMLQLLKNNGQEQTQLHFLAKQIAPEDVQFFYQLMLSGKKELEFAPEQRAGVEMTILRALAFHPKRAEEINRQPVREVVQTTATVSHTPQQNIEQLKARLTQNHALQAVNSAQNFVTQPATKQENSSAYQQPAASVVERGSAPVSPALAAMQARKQLQQTQAQLTQNEKKKPELAKPAISSASRPNSQKTPSLQERFMNLATEQQTQAQLQPTKQPEKLLSDEDYRWTWLNPELETQNESAKPSDIKQAILQERTPELVAKTIALSCEQDEWCQIVNELKLGGLSRQVALNSYLAEKQGEQLKLILKPAMAHLDNPESRQSLATALQEKGFSYELSIGESTEYKTPLEIRRAIFENLTLEAKKALTNDEKLMLLRQTFDAEIDESTIRAVAENKE
ncbi:DNA polymerase III subunit gamma/tau [Actinobacillus suis]|uniref:DNA polymerase III subunit gamma/tau n=1 Tax=Actinobacillus suis TaxID=716 RepID=A0ABT1WUH5_ACTSU|nr:DNA polymerase III subunit gamma/tau [Actinobacillus suis]AIJ30551.1 DNA polymerase III subunit gamma/tau [Actinobacillus suis ATCC 33415]MCO4169043.1 DNA polymerase III subunit gamma/tau [Actinobacillus suis]MCQ9630074.1 DNA polymerase III subunit gamma/tau [Actinobacillus suis]MCQ9631982.1 DNA polymerase III subunit gamma/tau [Actinobacillus suis]MCQ9711795.1 DNA polymerase III subunit gamma/tau [Actinobacillus suis]